MSVSGNGTPGIQGYAVDLGLGGVRVCSPFEPSIGECFDLVLEDLEHSVSFKAKACVRWVRQAEHSKYNEMGFEFVPELTSNALESFLTISAETATGDASA